MVVNIIKSELRNGMDLLLVICETPNRFCTTFYPLTQWGDFGQAKSTHRLRSKSDAKTGGSASWCYLQLITDKRLTTILIDFE